MHIGRNAPIFSRFDHTLAPLSRPSQHDTMRLECKRLRDLLHAKADMVIGLENRKLQLGALSRSRSPPDDSFSMTGPIVAMAATTVHQTRKEIEIRVEY